MCDRNRFAERGSIADPAIPKPERAFTSAIVVLLQKFADFSGSFSGPAMIYDALNADRYVGQLTRDTLRRYVRA